MKSLYIFNFKCEIDRTFTVFRLTVVIDIDWKALQQAVSCNLIFILLILVLENEEKNNLNKFNWIARYLQIFRIFEDTETKTNQPNQYRTKCSAHMLQCSYFLSLDPRKN